MYKIIGSDGKTYGPVDAEKIRSWLAQGRLDNRSPVLPEGAAEWTYLGLLPEFAPAGGGLPPIIAPPVIAPPPPLVKRTNDFALAGFVFGLLSLFLACCCGCPFSLLGLIFSIVALVQIGGQPEKEEGWGLALVGLICSVASLIFGLVLLRLKSSGW